MQKDKRNYNVFFNTHTVSGIVISVGLFVCFLAGAFALFLDDINYWQAGAKKEIYKTDIDYQRVISLAEAEGYKMEGRDFFIGLREAIPNQIQISSGPLAVDSAAVALPLSEQDSIAHSALFMKVDPESYAITATEFIRETTQLGTFLYHLHYFQQIPTVGIYLAGLVALFFAFALFTGIIIHWKKIVSNFFTFRLKGSVKNLWTDAHTALGVIGLPFQLMYAVTGSFFGLLIVLYLPFMMVLFDGDQEKMLEFFRPVVDSEEALANTEEKAVDINALVQKSLLEVEGVELERIAVQFNNYKEADAQMTVTAQSDGKREFMGTATTTYRLADGALIAHKPMDQNSFVESGPLVIAKLHFAQFGGYFLRVLFFILAIATCFVILSGVMIWLTARDKKTYAQKAKFNRNVGAIYLGACLGLYPAIALFFCMTKLLPLEFGAMTAIFFSFWLAYILYAYTIKNNFKINKHALLLAGSMGILIPILNGVQTGIWFWQAIPQGYIEFFVVDFGWLTMGLITLVGAFYAKPLGKTISVEEPSTSSVKRKGKVEETLEKALTSFKRKRPLQQ